MAGPSAAFLQALNAQLAGVPQNTLDIPADTITPAGAKYAAPPAVYNAPQSSAWVPPSDPFGAAQAPQTNASGVPNPPLDANPIPLPPTGTYGKDVPAGPPSPSAPAAPAGGGPSASPRPDVPPDVQFRSVGNVGAAPAREVATRGPTQNALLDRSFAYPMAAAADIRDRTTEQAGREQSMHEEIASHALERQAAFERQAQRRAMEMQALQADYQETIGQLSRFKLDHNRAWNNTSTLDKVGALALVMLGSIGTGNDPGKNIVLKSIMGTIEDDVERQKMSYQQGLDVAKGQQTAFSMAMQRYNSEDAAYHAALAAGQEAVASKIAGMNAQWKGVDAQNQADHIMGQLMMASDQNKAAGLKYLQPTMGSPKYKMYFRGKEAPGFYNEAKAQEKFEKYALDPDVEADKQMLGGAIQSKLQSQKSELEFQKNLAQHVVVLPNGEQIIAPTDKDKEKLQKLSTAVDNAQQLVKEAKEIRSHIGWHIDPAAIKRLNGIQSELTLAFKERGELGALSGPDMDLARGATGRITDHIAPGIDEQLDQFNSRTQAALRNYAKTIPGAPPKTSGQAPSGFVPDIPAHQGAR